MKSTTNRSALMTDFLLYARNVRTAAARTRRRQRASGHRACCAALLIPEQFDRAASLMRAKHLTAREIACLPDVMSSTLYRHPNRNE
ncbi:MAG: hypothetical protein OXG36_08880 [Caldilineaceae bacterium]|nr:hypothetical protein [Caldilineaceae bacterium]